MNLPHRMITACARRILYSLPKLSRASNRPGAAIIFRTFALKPTRDLNFPEGVTPITAKEAVLAIKEGEDFQVIDVRERDEFITRRATGTLNIPLSVFRENVARIDREATIFISSTFGKRASQASLILTHEFGFGSAQVKVVKGGFEALIEAGFVELNGPDSNPTMRFTGQSNTPLTAEK